MRAAAWSHARDIAAAVVSWDRAARLADQLPADDADRLSMRIAPRTLSCVNGFRVHKPIAGQRFNELHDLCTAAGDKASTAMAMTGLAGEVLMKGQMTDASQLSSEIMLLVESIGEPALIVGLAIAPMAVKLVTGEMAEVLQWSTRVIDLAEGDRAMGGYIVGSPLASAYAIRSSARRWLGRGGWREDFNRALAMSRDADSITKAAVIIYTYYDAIGAGAILADDTASCDIDEALRSAERASDDIALVLALYTKANELHQDPARHKDEIEVLRQARELTVGGQIYASIVPAIDARLAELMIERGDPSAIQQLRAGVDEMFDNGMFGYVPWASGVLVEALLRTDTEGDVTEAEDALDRLAAVSVLQGTVVRDLILLKSRALLARARGDEESYRDLANRYFDLATSLGFEVHIAIAEKMVGADGIEPPTAGV